MQPTALKVLRGNPGRRPLPPHEPQPPAGDPKAPGWLRSRARGFWRRLLPTVQVMRVMTVADDQALALLCDALAEYVDCRRVVRERGAVCQVETKRGLVERPRPEVAMAQDAWRRAQRMLMEFGLTPSARTRVHAAPAQESDALTEYLRGG